MPGSTAKIAQCRKCTWLGGVFKLQLFQLRRRRSLISRKAHALDSKVALVEDGHGYDSQPAGPIWGRLAGHLQQQAGQSIPQEPLLQYLRPEAPWLMTMQKTAPFGTEHSKGGLRP